jgi:hypothetical protein
MQRFDVGDAILIFVPAWWQTIFNGIDKLQSLYLLIELKKISLIFMNEMY